MERMPRGGRLEHGRSRKKFVFSYAEAEAGKGTTRVQHNPLSGLSGFKKFFPDSAVDAAELRVSGIGIREVMPPGFVERPRGSGDYLFVLFHSVAASGAAPAPPLHAGSDVLVIWPPGRGQFYGHPASRFTHSWLHGEGRRLRGIVAKAGLPLLTPIAAPDISQFQQALLDMCAELSMYTRPDPAILGNLLENGLRHLARSMGTRSSARIPESLLSVRRLMGSAPARPVTLAEMAGMAGMSVPHFCAVFKRTFGLPPKECLIYHRLYQAARLLADRNLTISEIAARVGYNDLFHFSKMFKKHFGVSPRKMRQRGGLGRTGGTGLAGREDAFMA